MTETTAKDVRAAFGACMKREGVERRGSSWIIRSPEVVAGIELQKSNYGPSFYCNIGFWLLALGAPTGKRLDTFEAHVHTSAEVVFVDDRHRIAALLDADAPMTIEQRVAGLCGFIKIQLLPLCAEAGTPEALKAMHSDGPLKGAGVRAPAIHLFH
jgi:hypothetical protein